MNAFLRWCLPSGLFAAVLFLLAVLVDSYRGKRRNAFRFGGTDVFSLGDERSWKKYFIIAIVWEILKSFATHDTAAELGATLLQSPFMVLTWFVLDRVHMAYEFRPELPELPKRIDYRVVQALENAEHAVAEDDVSAAHADDIIGGLPDEIDEKATFTCSQAIDVPLTQTRRAPTWWRNPLRWMRYRDLKRLERLSQANTHDSGAH